MANSDKIDLLVEMSDLDKNGTEFLVTFYSFLPGTIEFHEFFRIYEASTSDDLSDFLHFWTECYMYDEFSHVVILYRSLMIFSSIHRLFVRSNYSSVVEFLEQYLRL